MKIFDELQSPQDLYTCYNTCTCWRKILEPSKTQWLFDGVFPHLFDHLRVSSLFDLRFVCKRWRESVSAYLSEDGHHSQTEFFRCQCRDCRREEWTVKLNNNSQITQFLDVMKPRDSSSINPFVGRSVHLRGTWTVMPFLKTFGEQIWHLNIVVMTGTPTRDWILDCLSVMPNWRTFSVSPAFALGFNFKVTSSALILSSTKREQLELLLHLPRQPTLERLKLELNYYHERLLRDPENVDHFQLLSKILEKYMAEPNNKLHWISLSFPKQFAMQPPSRSETARRHNLFSKLPGLHFNLSQVTSLELRNVTTIPIHFLETFSETLERLTLIYDSVINDPLLKPVTCIKLAGDMIILAEGLWGKQLTQDEQNAIFTAEVWKILPNLKAVTIIVKVSSWEITEYTRVQRDEVLGVRRWRKIREGVHEGILLLLLCLAIAWLWNPTAACVFAVAYILPVMSSGKRMERVKNRIKAFLN